MASAPSFALPGQPLGPSARHAAGPGTHIYNDRLVASLLGPVSNLTPIRGSSGNSNKASLQSTLAITRPSNAPAPLPSINATVYARVTRLARLQAQCEILVTDDKVNTPVRAVLRAQDVRATEKDKVKITECFRVGDIVRATVVGLGDNTGGYFLSTAGNEFGVVMAWSEEGNVCVPVSWCEVRDRETGKKEPRKVAKPF
ncbi:hypothetical protein EJ06DRAFT_557933 [Trichodelitschia bisporula]|uniref:Exosome complex component CSL4 C-terminal domain-containing protein n=1 Tax=Trichodelitschia bisporula TaxID=703511 RepID=A0A6G1HS93_9PEZI|nr:hypothetical protein EJ06DRAFT_557933 [Trichodelitschia bisporula]